MDFRDLTLVHSKQILQENVIYISKKPEFNHQLLAFILSPGKPVQKPHAFIVSSLDAR